ncbi:MAG: L-serine ammonia-lyase, iron-sulfur-dependent subunit beta [Hungatella sp.]
MAFISAFDVLGPNMIGPSSSHTAGAVAIALLAQKMIAGPITRAEFTLYGSFAKTYRGHGTDRALLGGIMGFETDDVRIRDSFALAQELGLSYDFLINETETEVHPNTVDICLSNAKEDRLTVRGESLGGGKVRIVKINQVDVDFTGEYSAVIVIHKDKPGVVAHITKCLSDCNVNIAFMKLFREEKGATAYSIVESDEKLPLAVLDRIRENPHVRDTMLVQI